MDPVSQLRSRSLLSFVVTGDPIINFVVCL
jgi:hypothetical protein